MFIVCVCGGWCVSCLDVLINEFYVIGPIGFSLIWVKLVDDRMQTILFNIDFASMKQQKYTLFPMKVHEMHLCEGMTVCLQHIC